MAKENKRVLRLRGVEPRSGKVSEWQQFVWDVNTKAKERGEESVFGEPIHIGKWWAGGTVEEYDETRIIHRDDGTGTVNVIALSDRAASLFDAVGEETGNTTIKVQLGMR